MSTDARSDLQRLLSSTGLYAAAALAQQAAGFLLIPVYTRLIDPTEYGVLEVLNAFAAVAFACLTMGLGSAVNKCYHRDCQSSVDQASVLATAVLLDLPVLLLAGATLVVFATPITTWLVGRGGAEGLLILVVASGLCSSVAMLALSGLRAQERALAFSVLSLIQFSAALGLNLLFVVGYGLGVRGILWGNLLSNALVLPLAVVVAGKGASWALNPRLVRPLLSFGLYLVPVMLAGWVMDLSDRYLLRLYGDLDQVAVYGVGYKFGMIMQIAIVWPFQLAWPAFSFAISRRPGHQATYARTLTYLTAALVFVVLLMSLLAPVALPLVVGAAYRDAYRVIAVVALAYAFNGVQYCVAPGVHLAGRTKYLSVLAVLAALVNLALNLVLIPAFGMMGAAWSTLLAFFFLSAATAVLSQRAYPVAYEYGRLVKLVVAGVVVYAGATSITATTVASAFVWRLAMPLVVFPALLFGMAFLDDHERTLLSGLFRRYVPLFE